MSLLLSERAVSASPVPLLTAGRARREGIDVSGRDWHRIRHGVYAPSHAFAELPPWRRYAVRVHAFALMRPDVALSGPSAAVLHGLPLTTDPRLIHAIELSGGRSRRHGDVMLHTTDFIRDVTVIDGILCTTLLDTTTDLMRMLRPADALAAADAAISPAQGGTLSADDISARLDVLAAPGARGRRRAAWVQERMTPLAESPAESVSRAVIEWSGFEQPELQRVFRYEGATDRVDFHFPSNGAVGEADGWGKYDLMDAAHAAALLQDEKRREDRLRRNKHPVARWDLADARRVDPLQRALLAAGVRRVRPADEVALRRFRPSRETHLLR